MKYIRMIIEWWEARKRKKYWRDKYEEEHCCGPTMAEYYGWNDPD